MSSLPKGFIDMISQYAELDGLAEALTSAPEVSIRINRLKLPDYRTINEHVPWCNDGVYLNERPQFTFDPLLHQGAYYVQDASSMAITAAINAIVGNSDRPLRYLDACAAPGGKTTAAIGALPRGSVVVANEYDYRRAEILAENISKWGYPNVVVSRGDTSKLRKLKHTFDIVAVDAPCSGEGMMRKDQQAINQWSPSLIEQCAETQKQILSNLWDTIVPGGYLIYSTCTFNRIEDELNLQWLIENYDAEPIAIDCLDNNPAVVKGIDIPYPCYRFLPGKVRGEGLFMATVRKPGENTIRATAKGKNNSKRPDFAKTLDGWFTEPMEYNIVDDIVYAFPRENAAFMRNVVSALDVILTGVETATIKGRDIVPTHQLALSTAFNLNAFPSATLDYSQAISYLQRDNVSLSDTFPKGYVTLMYEGLPLGIIKNLGNRTNSLLPKQWRILSHQSPSDRQKVI